MKSDHRSHLKDEGAFQHKEFFALCPSENSWQIDAMNAKRKFQVFVLLRWPVVFSFRQWSLPERKCGELPSG